MGGTKYMGPNSGKIIRKLELFILSICFLFIVSIYVLSPFPRYEAVSINLPQRFEIPIKSAFEIQGKNQCAAFSTAFVLRNFGQYAKGSDVYTKLPYKNANSGYVLPKGIITYLQSQGYEATLFKSDLNSLKAKLVEESNPIIVLVGNGLFFQHYMTFVGFDDEKKELYFYDSVWEKDENGKLPGNRTMTSDYFSKFWSNGLPVFNHIYITVQKT